MANHMQTDFAHRVCKDSTDGAKAFIQLMEAAKIELEPIELAKAIHNLFFAASTQRQATLDLPATYSLMAPIEEVKRGYVTIELVNSPAYGKLIRVKTADFQPQFQAARITGEFMLQKNGRVHWVDMAVIERELAAANPSEMPRPLGLLLTVAIVVIASLQWTDYPFPLITGGLMLISIFARMVHMRRVMNLLQFLAIIIVIIGALISRLSS